MPAYELVNIWSQNELTGLWMTLPLGKQIQCGISYLLQPWPGLHRGDQTEIGGETEGVRTN